MAGIDAKLDDVQSEFEAFSRTADALHDDAVAFARALKRIRNLPLIRSLVRRTAELQMSAQDQRGALAELRESIAQLKEELKLSNRAVGRSMLSSAADRSRR